MSELQTVPTADNQLQSTGHWQPTRDQIELMKTTICKGSTDDEFKMFLNRCQQSGLDPFSGQIHFVKRWDSKLNKEVGSIQTGIDGLRLIAERTGKYLGQTAPLWCGKDGEWKDVWLDETQPPSACKIGVYKAGFAQPIWAVARWKSYAQTYKKNGQMHYSPMWKKMPDLMLSKVCEALALRKAFPADMSGHYAPEEMQQAEVKDVTSQGSEPRPVSSDVQKAEEAGRKAFLERRQAEPRNVTPEPDELDKALADEPPPMPPSGDKKVGRALSEKQIKRLYAIGSTSGWDTEQCRQYVKETYGKTPGELTRAEYDETCGYLEKNEFAEVSGGTSKPVNAIERMNAQIEKNKKQNSSEASEIPW